MREKDLPRILVFSSGSKTGGGSGFQELVENSRTGVLNAEIAAVVSNHPEGGVYKRAIDLDIPFIHMRPPYDARNYQKLIRVWEADYVALSGWLKMVEGHNSQRTFNIHPGPLPETKGFHGMGVHKEVIRLFIEGQLKQSAVSMHFVPDNGRYDTGPVFFQYPVLIQEGESPEDLAERVNKIEHSWQSYITNLVVHEKIRWDGSNPQSLVISPGFIL